MASPVADVPCIRPARVRNSSRIYGAVLGQPIIGVGVAGYSLAGMSSVN